MADSCSNILQQIKTDESDQNEDPRDRKKLKRPYPFPTTREDELDDEVIPEAVDVLDSIFASLCSFSEDSSTSNDISIVEKMNNVSFANKAVEESNPNEVEIVCSNDDASVGMDAQIETVNEPFEEIYDFTNIPMQVTGAWKEFGKGNNYTRGCKW